MNRISLREREKGVGEKENAWKDARRISPLSSTWSFKAAAAAAHFARSIF